MNDYYTPSGNPLTRSVSSSATMRNELASIQGAFDKLPNPYGGGTKGFSGGSWTGAVLTSSQITDSTWSKGTVGANKIHTVTTTGTDYASPFAAFGSDQVVGLYRVNSTHIAAALGVGGSGMTAHQIAFDKYANCIFGDTANAKATNATDGFLMIPTCAGTPTGTPAHLYNSSVPFIYDSTNNKLCVYDGGWKQTAALT